MHLTGQQLLELPRQRVWIALADANILRQAIPGCQSITDEGGGHFAVSVVAAVGPVKAKFKAKLHQDQLKPPQSYTLKFEGDGGMAGFASGTALITLEEIQNNGQLATVLKYEAQAQIGGRLAQIGSRLIDASATRMSQQFFERLTQTIIGPTKVQDNTETVSPITQETQPMIYSPDGHKAAPGSPRLWSAPVIIQMPAWTWSFMVAILALLAAWLFKH